MYDPRGGFSSESAPISDAYLSRIQKSYRLAALATAPTRSEVWAPIGARSAHLHKLLMGELDLPALRSVLRNPDEHHLFFGFDNLFKDDVAQLQADEALRAGRTAQVISLLRVLLEATGEARLFNSEAAAVTALQKGADLPIDEVLLALDAAMGPLRFVNPFKNEHGLETPYGIISYRAVHALYQAWRLRTVAVISGSRVLEIGAGLGRSAYHAISLGAAEYTIVDLPLTLVAQAVFLGVALGEDRVTLSGEPFKSDGVALVSPNALAQLGRSFDICVNADSITEMTREDASEYVALAASNHLAFLSINHEANPVTAPSLLGEDFDCIYRCPYWLRPGYLEEFYLPKRRTDPGPVRRWGWRGLVPRGVRHHSGGRRS